MIKAEDGKAFKKIVSSLSSREISLNQSRERKNLVLRKKRKEKDRNKKSTVIAYICLNSFDLCALDEKVSVEINLPASRKLF